MASQVPCWFVDFQFSDNPTRYANLVVAAFTERSAKVQVTRRLGAKGKIIRIVPIKWACAYVIDRAYP